MLNTVHRLAGGNLLEREVLNLSDAVNFANRQKAIVHKHSSPLLFRWRG